MGAPTVFVAYRADDADQRLGQAVGAPDAVRRYQQDLDRGAATWKNWALARGGSVVLAQGPEGVVQAPGDALGDVPALAHEYGTVVEGPVSLGVGLTLHEALLALREAVKRGGGQVIMYTEALGKAQGKAPSPRPKPDEANSPSAGGGFVDPQQGEAAPEQALPGPTGTHEDLAQALHGLAQAQAKRDQGPQEGTWDSVKRHVVQVLQKIRGQAQELEQLQQTNPRVYAAVMATVQTMIDMAHQLAPDTTQKSEALDKGDLVRPPFSTRESRGRVGPQRANPAPVVALPTGLRPDEAQAMAVAAQFEPPRLLARGIRGLDVYDYSHLLPETPYDESLLVSHAGAPENPVMVNWLREGKTLANHWIVPSTGTEPAFVSRAFASHVHGPAIEALQNHVNWVLAGKPEGSKVEPDPSQPPPQGPELDKNVVLPVGTQKDPSPQGTQGTQQGGQIKVQDPATGKSKWRSVRAGLVMAPDGTPVSALNPSGR